MPQPMRQSNVPGYPRRQGKVRDIYELGDRLIIVATDRISAFDWVLPTPIPDKGRILTALTLFWLRWLKVPNHLISAETRDFPAEFRGPEFAGRTMLVRKTEVVPVECVVRGYLVGSGWKDYKRTGAVCCVKLPAGLRESEQLPEPIFTPSTKAETGHDENISFEQVSATVGQKTADELRTKSLNLYRRAADYARGKGVMIADTKFEWGKLPSCELILIDEVLTPDSSRFWPGDSYQPGKSQPSFDKQFVRDWLESTTWDKNSPPPELPADVVDKTRTKYLEAVERITGARLPS
ncbi:MAG TPA: phosphoribosylaminoimidazolesuccinocarboxamide synthase [Gemmataceae bacterium]|nr:phosphoribosylaminoimidazolesuccinocarboxamide synthase [Gemmataceae bacterium]